MIRDETFKNELYESNNSLYEGPLIDRKKSYNLNDPRKKEDLVIDVIALSNSARHIGEPAFLVLGIEDKDGKVCGIYDMLRTAEGEEITQEEWDKLHNRISQILIRNIDPLTDFKFRRGRVEEKPVFYLELPPTCQPDVFTVKEDFPGSDSIKRGQSWTRVGESNAKIFVEPISKNQKPYCYSYAEVPFLIPEMWKGYLTNLLSNKELRTVDDIKFLQDIFVEGQFNITEKFEDFLKNSSRLLVISGLAGTGKTSCVKRWTEGLAESCLESVNGIIQRGRYHPPEVAVPLYFSLKGVQIHSGNKLAQELLSKLNSYYPLWETRPSYPERLFEYKDIHWLVVLDGLDEIWSFREQRLFLSALKTFINQFPLVKILLTSRPESSNHDWEELGGKQFEITPLSMDQVENYISSSWTKGFSEINGGTDAFDKVISTIKSDPDLMKICSIPACLQASIEELISTFVPSSENFDHETGPDKDVHVLVQPAGNKRVSEIIVGEEELLLENSYVDKTENKSPVNDYEIKDFELIPRKGVIVDYIYRRLWNREAKRRGLSPYSWWEETGLLALVTESCFSKQQTRRYLSNEKALFWCLGLGVLERSPTSSWFNFFSTITKAYFAATYLLPYIENAKEKETIQNYERIPTCFRNNVKSILTDLIPEKISSISL